MMVQEWIEVLPNDELRLTVVHPAGSLPQLPDAVATKELAEPADAWGWLRYEQRRLPRAARELGCNLLLVMDGGAPIAARPPTATLPFAFAGPSTGLAGTLQRAAGQAGRSAARLVLVPGDGPAQGSHTGRERSFPPFVSPAFADMPQGGKQLHVLCFGLRREEVALALAAWTWVDGSLGDSYPLMFLGIGAELEQFIRYMAAELDVQDSIAFVPEFDLDTLVSIYRDSAAYLGLNAAAWGQPLRWALAAGVPVAAVEGRLASSITRDAAYLAPGGDARALGAACLSLLVQQDLAQRQRQRGAEIAQVYFGLQPVETLRKLLVEAAVGEIA